MLLNYLKAKIHRATVTQADLNYEGSITIDQAIMAEAGIRPYEQVHVFNITNGNRLVTYTIEGTPGSGDCCINGAAARLVSPGDQVIIVAYCQIDDKEAADFQPRVLLMNEDNTIKDSFTVRANQPRPAGASLAERK